jgi:hypothetical protein
VAITAYCGSIEKADEARGWVRYFSIALAKQLLLTFS